MTRDHFSPIGYGTPMTDIVERLRDAATPWRSDIMDEAADEIQRLREEVATCRELRKYDRIEIERMRILLDRKTEG